MSRIRETFESLRSTGRKGFVPFVTAGDPDLETSFEIALTLAAKGADVIELGVPFSDPMADGPTIQRSSQRALENGTDLAAILRMVKDFRLRSEVPIVLFSYLNPILRFGLLERLDELNSAGIDGILITDAIDHEAREISAALAKYGIDLISLIAPTTSDERLADICVNARGFIYAISRAGVTGARSASSECAKTLVSRSRRYTDLPVAVGFGVSTCEQIEEVWQYADAAVVGSAIVAEIERADTNGDSVEKVTRFLESLLPFANGPDQN
ncbi:MAG: tryptophan synthase subunit alpha [Pyrinomonadaceae bacterium]